MTDNAYRCRLSGFRYPTSGARHRVTQFWFFLAFERRDEIFAHFANLPPAKAWHILKVTDFLWTLPRDRFESLARAEHSGVEIQSRRLGVTDRLELRDPVVEILFTIPLRSARESRKIFLRDFEPALHCGKNRRRTCLLYTSDAADE